MSLMTLISLSLLMENYNFVVGGGSYISTERPRRTIHVPRKSSYPGVKNVLSTLAPKQYVYQYVFQRQIIPDRRDLIAESVIEPVIAKPINRDREPVIAKPIIKPIAKKIIRPPLQGEQYISLDTNLPNKLVRQMLEKKELPFLKEWNLKKTEVKVDKHRFDFLLEKQESEFYLEVKSVTLVENGVAMFPDAVTERGKKHMEELSKLKESGSGAGVLFVCQRDDVREFMPHWERDPKFASSLLRANSIGVEVWIIACEVTSTEINYKFSIPYI